MTVRDSRAWRLPDTIPAHPSSSLLILSFPRSALPLRPFKLPDSKRQACEVAIQRPLPLSVRDTLPQGLLRLRYLRRPSSLQNPSPPQDIGQSRRALYCHASRRRIASPFQPRHRNLRYVTCPLSFRGILIPLSTSQPWGAAARSQCAMHGQNGSIATIRKS